MPYEHFVNLLPQVPTSKPAETLKTYTKLFSSDREIIIRICCIYVPVRTHRADKYPESCTDDRHPAFLFMSLACMKACNIRQVMS